MSNSLGLVYPALEDALDEIGEVSLQLYGLSAYFAALNLDDQDTDSWHDAAAALSLSLSLRYQDIGTDPIQIGYSHDGTTETLETVVTKTDTGLWKWKHYTLASTARMAHSVYESFGNADFRLECVSDLGVTNVSLRNVTTKAHLDWKASDEQPTDVEGTSIQDATISGDRLVNATITATQIANATITAAQIANATITGANIASATITGSNIASATIAGSNLVSGTITATQIAAGTITANEIANATITGAKIGAGQITGSNIAGGTITASNITSGTITATQIQALTITASEIANLTITAAQIANATITGANIANATIAGSNISAATITSSNIAGGTITGSNIASGTITGSNISNATITNSLLVDATITGAKIAGATITGSNIAATTITASNIAAGTITATQIASGTITATQIASGTITATQLSATAIDSMTITGATIRTASSGARVEMNTTKIFGYDGSANIWEIDSGGMRVLVGATMAVAKAFTLKSGSNTIGGVYGSDNAGAHTVQLSADSIAAADSNLNLFSDAPAGKSSSVSLDSLSAGVSNFSIGVSETGIGLSGKTFVNETENANAATGSITIHQGGNNNEAFAVKRSSVAHAMTTLTETDTYGTVSPAQTTNGGLQLSGYSASTIGLELTGVMTTDNTARSTSAVGAVTLDGRKKSGTGKGSLGANGNLFVVRDDTSARFLVDKEGDIHMDATSNINAWDDFDDVKLLEAFRVKTAGVNFKTSFARDVEQYARVLHETGVLTLNDDGHHFASIKGLFGLTIDAIRQMAQRLEKYERAFARLGVDVTRLDGQVV